MDKKVEDKIAPSSSSNCTNCKQILVMTKSAGIGLLFGFALEKAKVYDPQIIRDQMIFKRFIMIKMFFSALAASTIVVLIYRTRFPSAYAKILESSKDLLKKKSFVSLIVGGMILGFGMTVAGSCPGMMFVQLGAGVSYAYVGILGGFLAAVLHGYLNESLRAILEKPSPRTSRTFYELGNWTPSATHLAFGGCLLGGAALFEFFFPWRADFDLSNWSSPISYGLYSPAWPPIFAGIVLGSTQLLSFVIFNRSLGNSTTFSILAAQTFSSAKLEFNAYMKKFKQGNWDRVMMSVGALAGSFLSASLGGVYGKTSGVPLFSSFAGGFLLVFGARIADGCNTGHGISGTAHLLLGSAVATMAMFAGAMGLAYFM